MAGFYVLVFYGIVYLGLIVLGKIKNSKSNAIEYPVESNKKCPRCNYKNDIDEIKCVKCNTLLYKSVEKSIGGWGVSIFAILFAFLGLIIILSQSATSTKSVQQSQPQSYNPYINNKLVVTSKTIPPIEPNSTPSNQTQNNSPNDSMYKVVSSLVTACYEDGHDASSKINDYSDYDKYSEQFYSQTVETLKSVFSTYDIEIGPGNKDKLMKLCRVSCEYGLRDKLDGTHKLNSLLSVVQEQWGIPAEAVNANNIETNKPQQSNNQSTHPQAGDKIELACNNPAMKEHVKFKALAIVCKKLGVQGPPGEGETARSYITHVFTRANTNRYMSCDADLIIDSIAVELHYEVDTTDDGERMLTVRTGKYTVLK